MTGSDVSGALSIVNILRMKLEGQGTRGSGERDVQFFKTVWFHMKRDEHDSSQPCRLFMADHWRVDSQCLSILERARQLTRNWILSTQAKKYTETTGKRTVCAPTNCTHSARSRSGNFEAFDRHFSRTAFLCDMSHLNIFAPSLYEEGRR